MSPLSPAARTATTLAVLSALLVAGLAWGWSATTAPLPGTVELDSSCTRLELAEGDPVYPDQVLVSVLNAGTRDGLASTTMKLLVEQGFVAGDRGNAPRRSGVEKAEIWTGDPDSPAVRLVRSWLGKGVVVKSEPTTADGVVVVVGDGFTALANGRPKAAAKSDTTICSPPPPELAG
ncbi:LytR C-terminal domain-containing protein [Nocardioides sp. W7]|uniref:LytR C-terminal domain-containing protein n=1 Tax=Nocardioides sp. W7 TaxID=2931390 RepID=UPI001FD6168F|nr:LytR C-terminal domain-containing protein [Nocardioides sp. W7]